MRFLTQILFGQRHELLVPGIENSMAIYALADINDRTGSELIAEFIT